jgi:N-acetyl-gamma-glutamyl-phosphate reductase
MEGFFFCPGHMNGREQMAESTRYRAGIAGATGYTGLELVTWIQRHPALEIAWLTSESNTGKHFSEVHSVPWDYPLIPMEDALGRAGEVDVVFLCLPHGASIDAAQGFARTGVRVIDLSADFRLADAEAYCKWYGQEHTAPELLAEFVYGLAEINREQIRGARLIANPGCYPTSVNLGLYPLAKAGWLSQRVIIDSKSGISGAGRSTKLLYQFVEANENLTPYSMGKRHRHIAEMELVLNRAANGKGPYSFTFTPHLLPVNRGILSTMYVSLPPGVGEQQVRELYANTYAGEPFVTILPTSQVATLRHVTYSNRCAISITPVDPSGDGIDYIIVATIDNMVKGASGQAIQNFNIAVGLEETTGLL